MEELLGSKKGTMQGKGEQGCTGEEFMCRGFLLGDRSKALRQ